MTSEGKRRRGSYAKFSPEQQAAIGKYASLHANQAAIRHFSKQLEVELKVTSVHTWKIKYLAELNRKPVASLSFARKLLANNSSPDVFVDVVTTRFH